MKFGLTKEPAVYAEVVRQGVLLLVLFGFVQWTDAQIAAIVMFVSFVVTVFTRQTVMPVATIHEAGSSVNEIKAAAAVNVMVEEKRVEAEEQAEKDKLPIIQTPSDKEQK